MDRRHFLAASLFGSVGALAACKSQTVQDAVPNFSGATRPYAQLGVQLYTVRDLFQADYRSTLKTLADIGYKDLETAGFYDHDPMAVKAYMDELGLVSSSGHVQLDAVRTDFASVIALAKSMGQTNLVIPYFREEERTLEGYTELAALLNKRGEEARSEGLTLAYHNHDFEFERVDGRIAYDLLLEETDPENLKMEIDFFWVHKAGMDPLAYFAKWPGRFISSHVKDSSADGEMVAVGDGVIDFKRLFAASELAGMKHFYVEHDNPEDPIRSISRSFTYLNS